MPRRLSLVVVASCAVTFAASAASAAQAHAAVGTADTAPGISCSSLVGLVIPASAIGLPTSGGTVSQATTQNTSSGTAYCKPTMLLHPVDKTAPDITVQMGLPDAWHGRTIMFGGGGYDGTVPAPDGQVPFGAGAVPLDRGMVTYASDSGHVNSSTSLPTLDGSFAVNDEALRNFAGDALKKTHDAAMFVLARYYPTKPGPDQKYFAGGSSGGREALAVAQRWPQDFNGVISVYPAYNAPTLDLFFGYEARELSKPDAFPNTAQQKLLYQSVINSCDGLDGAMDGIISDEGSCHYDPSALRCPNGINGNTCLSDAMITALKAISSPIHFTYRLASGETGYPGFPFLSGADMTPPLLGMGTTAPAEPEPPTAGYGPQFWGQFVKYIVTRDPNYNNLSLDPLAPGAWQQRISDLTRLQDVNDTNLAPFAARGGKLLMVHGTADELVSHRSTVDYYKRVQATLGAARTRDFSRLYLVPGANHANLGGAFTAAWDSVTALESWVRDGKAPVSPVVADAYSAPARTRPLCEYDTYPRYVAGDINAANSFVCTATVAGGGSTAPVTGAPQPEQRTASSTATSGQRGSSSAAAVSSTRASRTLAATGSPAALPALGLAGLALAALARRRRPRPR